MPVAISYQLVNPGISATSLKKVVSNAIAHRPEEVAPQLYAAFEL